jgi:DNA (cytosine-5)-methyltransferase 1
VFAGHGEGEARVANALRVPSNGASWQGGSSDTFVAGTGVRRLTPTECERLQALPDGWTDFGPDSRRYSALGDAVTSSVAEWIGRRLISHFPTETAR